jgi:hypothetical protein
MRRLRRSPCFWPSRVQGRGDVSSRIYVQVISPAEHRRLHTACGDIPPAGFEAAFHSRLAATRGVSMNPMRFISPS